MKRIAAMAWVELIWIISAIRVFKLDFYTTAFTPLEEENETRET